MLASRIVQLQTCAIRRPRALFMLMAYIMRAESAITDMAPVKRGFTVHVRPVRDPGTGVRGDAARL